MVLVAVDFSSCATSVIDAAVDLARGAGQDLVVLHAAEAPRGLGLATVVGGATVADALTSDAAAHLAPLVDRAAAGGVAARPAVAFGRPAEAILAAAAREGARWIVVGTHGRTGLLRAVLGSVAEEVIRHADVPVLTVRSRWHEGCTARGCATCPSARTDVERGLAAEADG